MVCIREIARNHGAAPAYLILHLQNCQFQFYKESFLDNCAYPKHYAGHIPPKACCVHSLGSVQPYDCYKYLNGYGGIYISFNISFLISVNPIIEVCSQHVVLTDVAGSIPMIQVKFSAGISLAPLPPNLYSQTQKTLTDYASIPVKLIYPRLTGLFV